MKKPKCFISYSYDNDKHVRWVSRFAEKLAAQGINVIHDKSENLLFEDMNLFMSLIGSVDFLISICTPNYKEKNTNGAAFEKMLISNEVEKAPYAKKFLPILREGTKETSIPLFLNTKFQMTMKEKYVSEIKVKKIATSMKDLINYSGDSYNKLHDIKLKNESVNIVKNNNSFPQKKELRKATINKPVSTYLKISGLVLLGARGSDGVKYLWEKDGNIVESLAFNKRLKSEKKLDSIDENTSAYTSSVSFGCMLNTNATQCIFCETGKLKFIEQLTSENIALQNIFMAEYDSDCPSWPEVRTNDREFAYMGQGEPGYSYTNVRNSILLTDIAMKDINQKIKRYIISTCGISEFMPSFISDIKNGIFSNRVTLHFSLHAIDQDRDLLMPINKIYNYKNFLIACEELYETSKDKIGVGILLFSKISSTKSGIVHDYSLTKEKLDNILARLDPKIFKIDLCDLNKTTTINTQLPMTNQYAQSLLKFVQERGFEVKLFSSFGSDNASGCGMLKSDKKGIHKPGETTIEHYNNAIELLENAKRKLKKLI